LTHAVPWINHAQQEAQETVDKEWNDIYDKNPDLGWQYEQYEGPNPDYLEEGMEGYDEHMAKTPEERQQAIQKWYEGYDEHMNDRGEGPSITTDYRNYLNEFETELYKQKKIQAEQAGQPELPQQTAKTSKRVRKPHPSWQTGEPCYCSFNKRYVPPQAEWREAVFMDKEPDSCPTCGDPLEHGKCKRCDWSAAPSNAMTDGEPIADPTKELKPAVQSSIQKSP
jgi:hypothetical protein